MDLAHVILDDCVDFGYKKNATQVKFDKKTHSRKTSKINRSKFIDNIELSDYELKKQDSFMFIHPMKN